MPEMSPRVGLFVTCLVDLFRPSVGFAAVKLLEDAGCTVEVPEAQTCCGQPAFNSGDRADAAAIARNVIAAFKGYDYVVAPSGSCGGMIVKHYPELFAPGTADHEAALELAGRTHELVSFLTRVMKVEKVEASFPARATYHDSCSGLRELGIKAEPRKLLASVEGVSLARDDGRGGLLRLRRHLLRQVSRHLGQDAGEEAEAHSCHRCRHADRGRPRLPHEHGGQAQAPGLAPSRCATWPRCSPATM